MLIFDGLAQEAGVVANRKSKIEKHEEIKAVLFDLGDTILEFGKVETTKAFLEGARATHVFLKDHDQPVACFPWYFLRNLVRLRIKYLVADILRRDFDSLVVLQEVGAKLGVRLSQQQWEQFAWLWYEPLSRRAQDRGELAGRPWPACGAWA